MGDMGEALVRGPDSAFLVWDPPRRNGRWRAWAAFVALGAMLGSAYATGFATTGGAEGAAGSGLGGLTGPGAGEDAALLADKIDSGSDLRWNWIGTEGSVESTVMYTVDLDTLPASGRYFTSVMLVNEPSGFSDLQLQFRLAEVGAGGTCTTGALSAAGGADSRVMAFESADAQVTFSGLSGGNGGLPGGTTYCVGIVDYAGAGSDPGGTFIRRDSSGASFTGTLPRFVSTLEPASSG